MESIKPLRRIATALTLYCLPAAAVAGATGADLASAGFMDAGNPFLLSSLALLLLTLYLGWQCLRLKHQNMRDRSSTVAALTTMKELIQALQQNETDLRRQLVDQAAELGQIRTHPQQLTLQSYQEAPAKSAAR